MPQLPQPAGFLVSGPPALPRLRHLKEKHISNRNTRLAAGDMQCDNKEVVRKSALHCKAASPDPHVSSTRRRGIPKLSFAAHHDGEASGACAGFGAGPGPTVHQEDQRLRVVTVASTSSRDPGLPGTFKPNEPVRLCHGTSCDRHSSRPLASRLAPNVPPSPL